MKPVSVCGGGDVGGWGHERMGGGGVRMGVWGCVCGGVGGRMEKGNGVCRVAFGFWGFMVLHTR
jgi:hypothetical protein